MPVVNLLEYEVVNQAFQLLSRRRLLLCLSKHVSELLDVTGADNNPVVRIAKRAVVHQVEHDKQCSAYSQKIQQGFA